MLEKRSLCKQKTVWKGGLIQGEGIMKGRPDAQVKHYAMEGLCKEETLWKGGLMHKEDGMKGSADA